MGALPQTRHLNVPLRKGPAAEVRKLDRYGRDPESPAEKLRGPGFSPLYHSMLADLPRLVEGSAAGWSLVMTILRLSLGRPHAADKGRHEKTEPISTAELAEFCRVNVKTIQRQLDEMAQRGVITCEIQRAKKGGFIKYVLSLNLAEWQKLEDYPVWQRRQIKAINDPPAEGDDTEDSDQIPISKEAVHLFKRPAVARPGRATRAAKLTVGAREVVCQNDSPTVDVSFLAVVQSGRIVVSATVADSEVKAKGERKANDTHVALPSHGGNGSAKGETKANDTHVALPSHGGSGKVNTLHARSVEICKLFDPLLSRWASPLLSMDSAALRKACDELGFMPGEFLTHWLMRPDGRGARRISGPLAVAAIIREARGNWEKQSASFENIESQVARCGCGEPVAVDGKCWTCDAKRP